MPQFTRTAEEAITQARQNLPLADLIFQLCGIHPCKPCDCPLCNAKKKFGVYQRNGRDYFKCFSASCRAHDSGDEVDFLILVQDLPDRKSAFKEYLKLAGVD